MSSISVLRPPKDFALVTSSVVCLNSPLFREAGKNMKYFYLWIFVFKIDTKSKFFETLLQRQSSILALLLNEYFS